MVENADLQEWSQEMASSLIDALIRSEIVLAIERKRATAIAAEEIFGCLRACEPADALRASDEPATGRAEQVSIRGTAR